jgi:hypothetical protein
MGDTNGSVADLVMGNLPPFFFLLYAQTFLSQGCTSRIRISLDSVSGEKIKKEGETKGMSNGGIWMLLLRQSLYVKVV